MKLDCDVVSMPADGKSTRTVYVRGTPGKKLISWACTKESRGIHPVPITLFPIQHILELEEDGRAKMLVGPFPMNFGSLKPIMVNVTEEGSKSSEHFILHLTRPKTNKSCV